MFADMRYREAAEQAARQQQREEEALARRAANKEGKRFPERSVPERTESSERPTGPPRIALAGNKPTWREREAQKAAAGGGQAPPSAPPSDIATSEAQPPRKTGYLPPALRGDSAPRGRQNENMTSQPPRDERSTDSASKWRPSAPRPTSERDGSPATGPPPRAIPPSRPADGAPAKYVPRHLREGAPPARGDAPPPAPARTASPADGAPTGKWQPRFKRET